MPDMNIPGRIETRGYFKGVDDQWDLIRNGQRFVDGENIGWISTISNGNETLVVRDTRDQTIELLDLIADYDMELKRIAKNKWEGFLTDEIQKIWDERRAVWREPYANIPGIYNIAFANGLLYLDLQATDIEMPSPWSLNIEVGGVEKRRHLEQHGSSDYLSAFDSPIPFEALDGQFDIYPYLLFRA